MYLQPENAATEEELMHFIQHHQPDPQPLPHPQYQEVVDERGSDVAQAQARSRLSSVREESRQTRLQSQSANTSGNVGE